MRADVEPIVDRLTDSRHLRWLRVLDEAGLDGAAEQEADPETVVGPYQWLIGRVGDGLKLTQAGYLPPAVVVEALDTLGWRSDWYGKQNREEHARPLLEMRESAQRYGLLRKSRGQLLVTKLGHRLVDDPVGLWWHLADHLPEGRSEPERQAGVLYLLTLAAGRTMDEALIAEGMSVLGWVQGEAYRPLDPDSAFLALRDNYWRFLHLGLLPERRPWREPEPPPSPQARTLARAALLGRDSTRTAGDPEPVRSSAERTVHLHVSLRDVEPLIWRRLVVPASLTLRELHGVLQTAMGWEDYHLHLFDIAGVLYGAVEEIDDAPTGDEQTFTVGQAIEAASEFTYEYDFGDGWTHDLRVEQVMDGVGAGTPHLIGGARACPPEDCGGAWGYQNLLEVLADPNHEEYEQLLGWLGGSFDAEAFDIAARNADLELVDRHTRQRRLRTH